MSHSDVKYVFYPTLLDCFQNYLDSDIIWSKYWGRSYPPKITREEFRETNYQRLLDNINKVKGEPNVLADRGTVFNEIIDCLRERGNPKKINFKIEGNFVSGEINGNFFKFSLYECQKIADFYKNALDQVKVEGVLETNLGKVRLFGYIDELTFSKIYDIKTTGKYSIGKFCANWQHKVYPFCLKNEHLDLKEFVYDVIVMNEGNRIVSRSFETYAIKDEEPLIRQHCEKLINFVEENRNLIFNRSIFGEKIKTV